MLDQHSQFIIATLFAKIVKTSGFLTIQRFFYGARYRTRTCDPMHVKHVLYQLS